MNGLLLTALAFAVAGFAALIAGGITAGRVTIKPGGFGGVIGGIVLLIVCEAIAAILAVVGLVAKALT